MEDSRLIPPFVVYAYKVPAIIGMNLVTRLFVELRRAMLSTCEYSRLPRSPRLLVEPLQTRAEATGVLHCETVNPLTQNPQAMVQPQNCFVCILCTSYNSNIEKVLFKYTQDDDTRNIFINALCLQSDEINLTLVSKYR